MGQNDYVTRGLQKGSLFDVLNEICDGTNAGSNGESLNSARPLLKLARLQFENVCLYNVVTLTLGWRKSWKPSSNSAMSKDTSRTLLLSGLVRYNQPFKLMYRGERCFRSSLSSSVLPTRPPR